MHSNPSTLPFKSALIALTLGVGAATAARAAEPVALTHIHGLSYSADGSKLMIPSHHGLAVYEAGRWSKAPGPAHDYMGFSGTRDTLYSSGHPAPGSGLTNPFGLIKSQDGGKTWNKLGLEGESDFHLLATSYGTNAVYVVNPGPNSRMSRPGIYGTRNDGLKWTQAAAKGLGGELRSLAVHPSDPSVVAIGTTDGLYLSRDSADSFDQLVGGPQVLAETFDLDGKHLWFSAYSGKPQLMRIELKPDAEPQSVPLPPLADDAVAYIAQNPAKRDEIAIATFKRSVFLSNDRGKSWKKIAASGSAHE